MERIDQGQLKATFKYDTFGRLCKTTTEDLTVKSVLVTDLEYDDQGREIRRTLKLNQQPARIQEQSWLLDGQLECRHLQQGAISLLKETFDYDRRSRLAMHTNFGQIDTLTVTGTATGNHSVEIDASGYEPVAAGSIPVIHIAAGDAEFSLRDGPADLGAYSYELIKQGSNDWYLNTASKVISPGAASVVALFNTAPTVWYGELTTLRSRMGEVRKDNGKAGGWIRAYGNKFDVNASSGVAYQQSQQGFSFGADAPLPMGDDQWLVGLLGGFSQSDLNLSHGTSGTVDSYYAGLYTTWLAANGYYFDGVVKFNHLQNTSDVRLSDGKKTKGKYSNNAVGASLEFGRHIKLADDYFVEPYTQLSGVIVQGKSYALDNGLTAEADHTRSLLAEVGATVGRNFILGEGKVIQPYLRAAYAHEFASNNEVKVNNNVFNNDLSGSRGKLGAGIALTLTDKVSLHAEVEYSKGDKIEQPLGFNIGARYSW